MIQLKHHKASKRKAHSITLNSLALSENELVISGNVEGEIRAHRKFSQEDYTKNWGLWDYDVVEVFISFSQNTPYLEFQLSPLGQVFLLEIYRPRDDFKYPEHNLIQSEIKVSEKGWSFSMNIPLLQIPGYSKERNISDLYLNFHGCFFQEFLSLHLDPLDQPDFHRPNDFISLSELAL